MVKITRSESVRVVSGRWIRGCVGLVVVFAAAALMVLSAEMTSSTEGVVINGWPREVELGDPRVVVLKSKRILHLFNGGRLERSYDVALGGNPEGQKVCEGDKRTPEGVFRICAKRKNSKYHLFLGLNYPNAVSARLGLDSGLISLGEYENIVRAENEGRCPCWTTALGGAIGLHGHGTNGDWTAGCIALTDKDIEELFAVLRVGDEVEILP